MFLERLKAQQSRERWCRHIFFTSQVHRVLRSAAWKRLLPWFLLFQLDIVERQFQFLVASYVADLPEAGDLLSVKQGSWSYYPSHMCSIKNRLSRIKRARCRSVSDTLKQMTCLRGPKSSLRAKNDFNNYSLCARLKRSRFKHFPFYRVSSIFWGLFCL